MPSELPDLAKISSRLNNRPKENIDQVKQDDLVIESKQEATSLLDDAVSSPQAQNDDLLQETTKSIQEEVKTPNIESDETEIVSESKIFGEDNTFDQWMMLKLPALKNQCKFLRFCILFEQTDKILLGIFSKRLI